MLKKNTSRLLFLVVGLLSVTLVSAAWVQMSARYLTASLQAKPVVLSVTMLAQSRATSCGEAAIAMAYNYAYPQTTLNEQTVIEYGTNQGYFTEAVSPYTSPVNMMNIAENYAKNISTGTVNTSNGGLALLLKKLQLGDPVIIDVLSNLTNPTSEAHFIVVTGMSVDPNQGNALVIHYNDPFTGKAEITAWAGKEGIWNAWQKNGDPGGSGWWLVISASK
jgi:hypothetical protein